MLHEFKWLRGIVEALQNGTLDFLGDINIPLGHNFKINNVPISGLNTITYTGEADEIILQGQPVYTKATTHVALAKAVTPTQIVSGLATADCIVGASCTYQFDETLTLADWTNVIGAATLTTDSYYYLDPSNFGKLTSTAPTTTGQYVVEVGKALDTVTLEITNKLNVLL